MQLATPELAQFIKWSSTEWKAEFVSVSTVSRPILWYKFSSILLEKE
jgi:hypothetical protein